jgi:exopolyphosphatase/guanosine-5'-triphosphate,3'-diphosphate pyrophosphatase
VIGSVIRFLRPDRDVLAERETAPVTRVGVIDVGANTVRLLVAELHAGVASPLEEDKEQLSLGADVERNGRISKRLVADTAATVERFANRARSLGSAQLEVLVTSPGRQASNGEALVAALAKASSVPARVLSAQEEGELAFRGATSGMDPVAGGTLVCDVGGGSAQIVYGRDVDAIAWWHSLDVGSLRLTNRFGLDADVVSVKTVERAREAVAELVEPLSIPVCERALAAGGTARALHKILGRRLGVDELARAADLTRERAPKDVAESYGISRRRAERLLGGTLILQAIEQKLRVPFEVGAGGIREGAVLTLLARELAA